MPAGQLIHAGSNLHPNGQQIYAGSNVHPMDSWCTPDLTYASQTAVMDSWCTPDLTYASRTAVMDSWCTPDLTYASRTADMHWLKLVPDGQLTHAGSNLCLTCACQIQLTPHGRLIWDGSDIHPADRWYLLDLTSVSQTTDKCLAWQLIHAGPNLHLVGSWYKPGLTWLMPAG